MLNWECDELDGSLILGKYLNCKTIDYNRLFDVILRYEIKKKNK